MEYIIKIKVNDNQQLEADIQPQMTLDAWMNISSTLTLDFLNQVARQPDSEEDRQELKEYLFDQANEVFSTILASFAPEIDLRPDITEEAIMELEMKNLKDKSKNSKPKLEVVRNKR